MEFFTGPWNRQQKMGFIRNNPTEAVTLPRIEKKQIKPMEDEELTAFLNAIKGNPYELVFYVTVFTGLREGEVLGLTWDCVDFSNGTLLINKAARQGERHQGVQIQQPQE